MVDNDVADGFWELTVRGEFSAAHYLRGYQGKCENPHGHNFGVEVSVRGARLDPDTGMLLDFGIIKKCLRHVLEKLDHTELNSIPHFGGINPSSENLALYIGANMRKALRECGDPQTAHVRLHKVTVSEKATQNAAWIAVDTP